MQHLPKRPPRDEAAAEYTRLWGTLGWNKVTDEELREAKMNEGRLTLMVRD